MLLLVVPETPCQRRMKYLVAYEGPELVQIDDGLVIMVLPDVEVSHSNLQKKSSVIEPHRR